MDAILQAHTHLEHKGNLSKALTDVQTLIDHLQRARDAVAENPDMTALHLAKLKNPVKQSFDAIEDDLKEVNKGLNQYQKALRDKFKNSALPTAGVGESGVLARETGLVNRAIGMHLLREGKFDVASTFVREVNAGQRQSSTPPAQPAEAMDGVVLDGMASDQQWIQDFSGDHAMVEEDDDDDDGGGDEEGMNTTGRLGRGQLQRRFADMYHILDALRNQHNLTPAIDWARQHSAALEARGSNLEFELSRLKFVELYTGATSSPPSSLSLGDGHDDDPTFSGPIRALQYARTVFPTFSARYARETSSLLGSLAFSPGLPSSPYTHYFHNTHSWQSTSASFTREFCGLLGLSERSPLYTAVTAGGIALPVLEKVERVMAQTRGQWTSVNELPVETPLPPGYLFHSIFVCPVSKEQATDANPPMMLPCGHVIAKESLEMHGKGKARVKCPYCPQECLAREARRVYI